MNLIAEIKRKNDQLLLQRVGLQQQLHARLNAPAFASFLITFAAAPFIIGAITRITVTPSIFVKHKLYHSLFPYLNL